MMNLEIIKLEFNQLVKIYSGKSVDVAAYDDKGVFIMASHAGETYYSCNEDDSCPITKSLLNDSNLSESEITELKNNGAIRFIKDIYCCKDKSKVLHKYEISLSTIIIDNAIIGYILICEDIANQFARNGITEDEIQSVFKALSHSKIITQYLNLRTKRHIAFVNGECIELTLEKLNEVIHPDDKQPMLNYLDKLITGKMDVGKITCRFNINNEDYRVYESALRAIYNDKGIRVSIIGTQRDITDEIERENRLKQNKKELQLLNNQLNTVLNMSRIVPFIWYPDREEFYMNMMAIKDSYKEFVKGNNVMSYDKVIEYNHPDNREEVIKMLDDVRSGRKKSACCKTRYDSYGKWEKTFIVSVGQNISDQDGEQSFMGFMQDITSDELLKEELILAKLKAEESEKTRAAFIANMSHEIRTPLNAIVGFSDLINETEDPNERKEFFEIIQKNNNLLLQLVNDIIELSRIDSGKIERMPKRINIREFFEENEGMFRLMVDKSEIDVEIDIPQEDTFAILDKRRLNEVMTNFLSNANKYTKEGKIKLGFVPLPESKVKFYVQDTGCGISEEDCKKVFNRFEKLGSFKQGAGLGMAICEKYAKAADGEIGVTSVLGKGSTFYIIVPTGL